MKEFKTINYLMPMLDQVMNSHQYYPKLALINHSMDHFKKLLRVVKL